MLKSDLTEEDNTKVIAALRRHSNARAVILVSDSAQVKKILEAAQRINARGEFIWIISDSLGDLSSLLDATDVIQGSFVVTGHQVQHPTFD